MCRFRVAPRSAAEFRSRPHCFSASRGRRGDRAGANACPETTLIRATRRCSSSAYRPARASAARSAASTSTEFATGTTPQGDVATSDGKRKAIVRREACQPDPRGSPRRDALARAAGDLAIPFVALESSADERAGTSRVANSVVRTGGARMTKAVVRDPPGNVPLSPNSGWRLAVTDRRDASAASAQCCDALGARVIRG